MSTVTTSWPYNHLLSSTARDRLVSLSEMISSLYHVEVTDVFVSTIVNSENKIEYQSFWYFTGDYVLEAKQPLTDDKCDIALGRSNIHYIEVSKRDFDLERWSEASRISLHFGTRDGVVGTLQAARDNCPELVRVMKEWFTPNLVKMPLAGQGDRRVDR